ncbi:MAG: hypothetical protein IJA78_05645 [Clostridia bacterium]|nr:hypothetical protein [Clostridia bacterium]MBQ7352786.1 hypothetical protein [Clostridia bacterium]
MARSEAQKAADKRYAEKVKDKHKQFAVNLKADEYERITAALAAAGMSKADFLRWAVDKLQGK